MKIDFYKKLKEKKQETKVLRSLFKKSWDKNRSMFSAEKQSYGKAGVLPSGRGFVLIFVRPWISSPERQYTKSDYVRLPCCLLDANHLSFVKFP